MARKTRKSSSKTMVMDGLLYGGGVAAGGWLVPKVVGAADPTGRLDPKIINVATAAVGLMGAGYVGKNINQDLGKVTLGIGIGAVAALIADVAGIGYVVSPSYDVNNVVGLQDDFRGTTGLNPGAI